MIISGLDSAKIPDGRSMSAKIEWEDNAFPEATLYFECRGEETAADAPSPEAFLVAGFPMATAHAEVRLRIEGSPSPMLVDGLQMAHALWASWGGVSAKPPIIETQGRPSRRDRMRRKRGVVSLSGGVDGLHTLMRNHRLYRRGDPAYIQAGLFVHGFDIGKRARAPEEDRSRIALGLIRSVAAEAGVNVLTCRTNLRHLPEKAGFWTYRQNAAALTAAAYAVIPFPAYFYIASTYQLAHMVPMGSHPALDIHYSNQEITVLHDGARFTRLEKIRELAAWPRAISSLRVCPGAAGPEPNCKRCEKCLRTRLELLAVGIDESPTLGPSLTPVEEWEAIPPTIGHRAFMYEELLEPLRARGLDDLCQMLERRITAYKSWTTTGAPWPTH
jgi:hypothetical protein